MSPSQLGLKGGMNATKQTDSILQLAAKESYSRITAEVAVWIANELVFSPQHVHRTSVNLSKQPKIHQDTQESRC